MVSQRKCSLVCFVFFLGGAAASAQQPDRAPLKSQVLTWEQTKSHSAEWGTMHRYFAGETFTTEGTYVAAAVVQPGKAVHAAHRHAEEEYLAVVEGQGTWSLDGKRFPAKRGDMLYVASWVYHGLINTGDTPLIFLVIKYNGKGVKPPPRPDDRPDELAAPSLPKVSGVVTFLGEPLANATVTFSSEKRSGPAGRAKTDAQGRYVLQTPGQEDGLAPGTYTVTIKKNGDIQTEKDGEQEGKPAADNVLPQRFASPEATGLRVMVVEGSNDFQFDLSK